jgi:hypothetical protein
MTGCAQCCVEAHGWWHLEHLLWNIGKEKCPNTESRIFRTHVDTKLCHTFGVLNSHVEFDHTLKIHSVYLIQMPCRFMCFSRSVSFIRKVPGTNLVLGVLYLGLSRLASFWLALWGALLESYSSQTLNLPHFSNDWMPFIYYNFILHYCDETYFVRSLLILDQPFYYGLTSPTINSGEGAIVKFIY